MKINFREIMHALVVRNRAVDNRPKTHHNTCPMRERCACYLTGYTDAEYDYGFALDSLEPPKQ